ncbi:FMN-linked oxidoreductase [Viridothelium virens]|uniref:Dihydroorotate dehydrogenase (quinone), mitochondrial n=1 Tax=Viridothelium virens TaxID=1048519 RepID=A0A6A6HBX5_VIRVR|nr:FMN-linked oxidoreductase [Viridothelium virens]
MIENSQSLAHLRHTLLQNQKLPKFSTRLLSTPTPLRLGREDVFLRVLGRGGPQRRSFSSSDVAAGTTNLVTRLRFFFYGTSLVLFTYLGYIYITDTRAAIHTYLIIPALRFLYPDPEDAHEVGNAALKALYTWGLHPRERGQPDVTGDLQTEVFGYTLANPIGTSAGIDKNAEIPSPLLALGPAIVEVGGVTPHPQEGNARPRVFRLPSQNALINRYGLNSEGAEFVAMRLRQRLREFAYNEGFGLDEDAEKIVLDGGANVPPGSLTPGKLLAVQVAKNKFTPDADIRAVTQDYVTCVDIVGKYADILVVNVSSPNTPGLRSLQRVEPLTAILTGVVQAAKQVDRKSKPAVMVKVSPDEDTDEQVSGICEAVWEAGVDGVIVGNTTKRRPEPVPRGHTLPAKELNMLSEVGGYSGPQLFDRTVALVKRYRRLLDERPQRFPPELENTKAAATSTPSTDDGMEQATAQKIEASQGPNPVRPSPNNHLGNNDRPKTIFATGGITNGKQALEVLNSGADIAQVYTAMVYSGASTISRIKAEMRDEIKKQSTKGKP